MVNPKDIRRAMTNPSRLFGPVERLLLTQNAEKSAKRDKLHLHPSEICKKDWCPRSSYYRIIGMPEPEESLTLQKLNIFAVGNIIHEKWQNWLLEAEVLEQAEVPIYDEEHRIMGHADGVISDVKGRAVLEIKTVGVGTVRFEDYDLFSSYSSGDKTLEQLWSSIHRPFPSHIRQVQLYMYCLGIDEGIVLYEWKPTQELKEFVVKYQSEIVEPILASCLTVVRALESGTPPERPMWLYEDHRVCKYCPFRTECWKNENSGVRGPGSESGASGVPVAGRDEQVSSAVRVARPSNGQRTGNAGQPRRIVRQ